MVGWTRGLATGNGACRAIVSLGFRKGTKAKSVQSVVCRNLVIICVLRLLCNSGRPVTTLMGCSYDTYRKLIRSAQVQARLETGYTPHSPRAGFATESIAEGRDVVSVRESGRWLSGTSLRVYLDLVGAASLAQQHKVQGREHDLIFAATNFLESLPGAFDFQRAEDHHGSQERDAFARTRCEAATASSGSSSAKTFRSTKCFWPG